MNNQQRRKRIKTEPLGEVRLDSQEALLSWLANKAPEGADTLLAHCYGGVVWGRRADGTWMLSSDLAAEFSPPLVPDTLLQARVFGEKGEVFVWRDDGSFRARVITSEGADGLEVDWYAEDQWLWGTRIDRGDVTIDRKLGQAGFTLLADGAQGLRHAVPFKVDEGHFEPETGNERRHYRPVRLRVEHYFSQDEETGLARVYASRLAKLFSEPFAGKEQRS